MQKLIGALFLFFFKKSIVFNVDKTHFISLDHKIDRRELLKSNFPNLKMTWKVAVNGRKLDLKNLPHNLILENKGLLLGQIGVFISHYELWQAMTKSEDKYWLILEDDAMLRINSNTLPLINKANHHLKEHNFDIFFLGRGVRFENEKNFKSDKNIKIAQRSWQAHAYIISKNGAKKLLSKGNMLNLPLDEWWWQFEDINFIALEPDLIIQRPNLDSDINLEE